MPKNPQRSPPAHRTSPEGEQLKKFKAVLEHDGTDLNWTIAHIPPGVVESWTARRRLRVRGEINGAPFRTSLFPRRDGRPGFFILINKQTQKAAKVRLGEIVEISLEPDLEDRPSALPPELLSAFEGDRLLRQWAEALSESTRREIVKWIALAKTPSGRAQRSGQMAERMLLTMEGEMEVPPLLQALFASNPRALAGWEAFTPLQRRSHLFAIFYYATPAARSRRAEKAVQEALSLADRISPALKRSAAVGKSAVESRL